MEVAVVSPERLPECDSRVWTARCGLLLRATHVRGREEAIRGAHAGVRIFERAGGGLVYYVSLTSIPRARRIVGIARGGR